LGQWYEVTGTFLFLVQGESVGRKCGGKVQTKRKESFALGCFVRGVGNRREILPRFAALDDGHRRLGGRVMGEEKRAFGFRREGSKI
jgi:hypothetical protein